MDDVLYLKHRPTTFKAVVGQPDAVKTLAAMAKKRVFPHALAFFGDSGCGKTTMARITATKLKCGKADFTEVNAAESRGIDMVRQIQKRMGLSPIAGPVRVWLIDECHQLTAEAQGAFLKLLEDTPKHVYFMLCTTDPQKLKTTIKTRCTKIVVKPVKSRDMTILVERVAKVEGITLNEEVTEKIVECAEGSCRQALVSLNAIMGMDDPEEMLDAVSSADVEADAFDLAKMLMNAKCQWNTVAKKLKELDEHDPEGIRRMVMGFARGCLLGKGNHERAYNVLASFENNFFDSGKAGLARACYEVVKGL